MKRHKTMWVTVVSVAGLLVLPTARANDSFKAEASHFAGNTVIAGATTVVVDKYLPKVQKPALAGFIVSATEALLGECLDEATGSGFSVLDVAVGVAGAGVGAFATHEWYIVPKLSTAKGETTCSVLVSKHF